MRMLRSCLGIGVFLVVLGSCKENFGGTAEAPPILGETSVASLEQALLTSQTGVTYTASTDDKIQVVDFFFTSCPTICPKMTSHLTVVQEHFEGNGKVEILSYSIDGRTDTPEVLENYAIAYGINEDQWKLLTGDPDTIFKISKGYKVMAFDDSIGEERNLIHDGTFVLVDNKKRIRGYYNGLDLSDTQKLISDMEKLLKTL